MFGLTENPHRGSSSKIVCDCLLEDNTLCHVIKIIKEFDQREFRRHNLPGVLPPEIVKLRYLKEISLLVNRFSGKIPVELGNITTLAHLSLEANQFSGSIPSELGRLSNLETLVLSSNQLTGTLPTTFAGLGNLIDLVLHGSGLQGPIPANISLLINLEDLRISDIRGPTQGFPDLVNMTGLVQLVLRNCNIAGKIPPYLWTMQTMEMMDLSFNQLTGEVPEDTDLERIRFLFLTGNKLSGNIPDSILKDGTNEYESELVSKFFLQRLLWDFFIGKAPFEYSGRVKTIQACHLQQSGNLVELVDEKLKSEINWYEARNMVKIALLCTHASPSIRPSMSEVVNMLEGRLEIPDLVLEPSSYNEDLRFKAMRDMRKEQQNQTPKAGQTQTSTALSFESSPTSGNEFYDINPSSSSSLI
ncbi:putative LRR receptor-like serine/threonine-protein kinase RFK1, partial [Cucurbita argyrosperma subsp. argyrosperma]